MDNVVPSVPSGIAVYNWMSSTSPALMTGAAGMVIVVAPPVVVTEVALILTGKLQQHDINFSFKKRGGTPSPRYLSHLYRWIILNLE
jgi:hypothetical protein